MRSAENIEELGETNWASKLVFDTSAIDKKDVSGRNNKYRIINGHFSSRFIMKLSIFPDAEPMETEQEKTVETEQENTGMSSLQHVPK